MPSPMRLVVTLLVAFNASLANCRYVMYLTGQHPNIPSDHLVADVTHVALAFMSPSVFVDEPSDIHEWPLFTSVADVRSRFAPGTAIMVAIGGWANVEGFERAAVTDSSRKLFARRVKQMLDDTGADGVDIDWEYPGGNGEDYKIHPNPTKSWQIEAYPELLAAIRAELGSSKLISAAVPGLRRDMLAFTDSTVPAMTPSLDFVNVMTYDLMNRRDTVTKHHTGIETSLDAIEAYHERGVAYETMSLGFAFYVKWFKTDPAGGCDTEPVGCRTPVMEDPDTGADLGMAGAFSWHDDVPEDLIASYERAMRDPVFDPKEGGVYHWDSKGNMFWSWDTPGMIARKFEKIMQVKSLGGAFAWALGEDGDDFLHLEALNKEMREWQRKQQAGSLGAGKQEQELPWRDEL